MSRKLNINWYIKDTKPTKTNINSLKKYTKNLIKERALTSNNTQLLDLIKSYKAITKLETTKKPTKALRKKISKIWANENVEKSNNTFYVKGFKTTKISKKKLKETQPNFITKWTLKKLDEVIKEDLPKLKTPKLKNQVQVRKPRKRTNKSIVDHLKTNNANIVNEFATFNKISKKEATKELTAISNNEQENSIFDRLTLNALNNPTIGGIIENMGGWANANAKYSDDLERLINNYGDDELKELWEQYNNQ